MANRTLSLCPLGGFPILGVSVAVMCAHSSLHVFLCPSALLGGQLEVGGRHLAPRPAHSRWANMSETGPRDAPLQDRPASQGAGSGVNVDLQGGT